MTASVSASCASSTAANALKRSISPTAAAAAAASIHSKKLNQTYSRFSYITASPTNTKMPETYNSSSSSSSSSSSNITLYPQSHDLPSNSIKIVSWNVAGLKAALGKGFRPYIQAEDADIVCLQETKLNPGNDLQTGVFDKKVYPFQ